MELIQGIRYTVSAPVTYKMTYLNGTFAYTEPFAILDISADMVEEFTNSADTWVHGVLAALNAAGAAGTAGLSIPITGAISAIIEFAYNALKGWVINDNGSASLAFAYHYAGTRKAGIDLTASPIPGFDANEWYGIVNQMMRYRFNAELATQVGFDALNESTLKLESENLELIGASPEGNNGMFKIEGWGSDFYNAFSTCMTTNGLPVPTSLFDSQQRALSTINSLYAVVVSFGTKVTVAELVIAGKLPEILAVVGAVSAAYYLGACIGCGISAGISATDLPSIFW